MKILVLADEECKAYWDHYKPGRLSPYDLILSCGDLKAEYLSFLVTMGKIPLFYVHGNHDGRYEKAPPYGCVNIDGHLVVYNGVRILGLGGCMRYHDGPHQYTENQMLWRILRLRLAIARVGGVDIVVTHAPPEGLGDLSDPAHKGFACLRDLIERYHPAYLVHGHVHLRYAHSLSRELVHDGTHIVNASERFVLDIPDRPVPPEKRDTVQFISRRKKEPDFDFRDFEQEEP